MFKAELAQNQQFPKIIENINVFSNKGYMNNLFPRPLFQTNFPNKSFLFNSTCCPAFFHISHKKDIWTTSTIVKKLQKL